MTGIFDTNEMSWMPANIYGKNIVLYLEWAILVVSKKQISKTGFHLTGGSNFSVYNPLHTVSINSQVCKIIQLCFYIFPLFIPAF